MNWERGFYRWTARKDRTYGDRNYRRVLAAVLFFMGFGTVANPASAEVTVKDSAYAKNVTKTGDVYEITNQMVKDKNALNRFKAFSIGEQEIANLRLGDADRQINIVDNKINIDGVVNAFKDGKIGGDVYFLSGHGIAVGATGVINVGKLTLGTNTSFGTDLYNGYISDYEKMTALERGELAGYSGVKGSAITVSGKIYAADRDVVIAAPGEVNLEGAEIYAAVDFNTPGGNWTAADYRKSFVNLSGAVNAAKAVQTTEGIALVTKDNLTVSNSKIFSNGGAIKLFSYPQSADLQAEMENPENGGVIVIKNSTLDSSSSVQDSGAVSIASDRHRMGVAKVEMTGTTVNAAGTSGHAAGNVTIEAAAQTDLQSWDIGDGAYAAVNLGTKEGTNKNTIKGDNVTIRAVASTDGEVGDNTNAAGDAELKERLTDSGNSFLSMLGSTASMFRGVASVTKIHADAEVNIYDTEISAVGKAGSAAGETHGQLTIGTDAVSGIKTVTIGGVSYGFNVGISDLSSKVNIDRSALYSYGDTAIGAAGTNSVSLSFTEMALLESFVRSTVDISWAELSSDVAVNAGKDSEIVSGGNVSASAESTRTLSSIVYNGSDTNVIGAAVSVAKADTEAEVSLEGNIYAAGDVKAKAYNHVAVTEGDLPAADASKAASMSGDSFLKKAVEGGKDIGGAIRDGLTSGGGSFISGIKNMWHKGSSSVNDAGSQSQVWNKFGLNASTALLFSDNTASASVTGKVRGAVKNNSTGNFEKSETVGAKSLSVNADTLSRVAVRSLTYQTAVTGASSTRKDTAVALALDYAEENNTAKAYIGGDIKTAGDITVAAKNYEPYAKELNTVNLDNLSTILTWAGLNSIDEEPLSDMFDSWSQAAGEGESTSGSASIGIVEYGNTAEAYIADGAKISADGKVDVDAQNDTISVSITGDLKNPMKQSAWGIISLDRHFSTYLQNPLGGNTKNSIGGAAISVHQKNTAKAYVGKNASVAAADDVSVTAENKAKVITIAAAGAIASDTAVQGTVGVNRITNRTEAYAGENSSITSKNKDVDFNAEDGSIIVNAAGTFGMSGDTSIGATIGYNHIDRETKAYSLGNLAAGGNASVSAKNSGLLFTASAAGTVTHDGKEPSVPEGGEANAAGSSDLSGLAGSLLNVDVPDEVVAAIDDGAGVAQQAQNVGAGDQLADKAEAAKKGFSLSASVGVNRVLDTAEAYLIGGSVKAGALQISAVNDSAITAVTGDAALSFNNAGGTGIAGSFLYNSITADAKVYASGTEFNLTGNKEKDKDGKEIDEALTASAENAEVVTNIAVSGSGTSKGSAVAGQISVNRIDDTTRVYINGSTIKADKAVKLSAADGAKLRSYTGALSVSASGEGTAVGASVGVNVVAGDTSAYMDNSSYGGTSGGKGGSLSVLAEEKGDVTSVVVGGGAADGFTGAFSANAGIIKTDADARISTAEAVSAGSLSVSALNGGSVTLGTGSAAAGNNAAGMAIGVNVSQLGASAALTGDAKRENAISADSISIKAENDFNKDAAAVDTDKSIAEQGSAKNVAVGAAAGASKVGGSGSVTMNFVTQVTDAKIGAGRYESAGAVRVDAETAAKLFGLAGGVGASGGTGIGAGVDTQSYSGHTYASIEDGARILKAGAVTVKAAAAEDLVSVGFAGGFGGSYSGAGAAGLHFIETDTKAYIGNEKDTALEDDADQHAEINAGTVSVTASDATKISATSAGGSGSGTAAGGLSAAVETLEKNVAAYVGNHAVLSGTGLTVSAVNTGTANTNAVGLAGAGTWDFTGTASEIFADYVTKAYVGDGAEVRVSGENNTGASITAESRFSETADATSVSGAGTFAAGLGNATASLTADTEAYAGKAAKISGGKKVEISAAQDTNLTYATVAGTASGQGAASGALGWNDLKTKTYAYAAEDAKLSADGTDGISVAASDATKLSGGTGGAAIGGAGGGGGVAVTVNKISKDTKAYVGKNASLSSKGKISLSASNMEDIVSWTVQGAGGTYAGLAGASTVTRITSVAEAFTQTAVSINQTDGYKETGGDISVAASHEIKQLGSTVAGASGGAVGVSAAVDKAEISTRTNAYIGDGNLVATKGALTVAAKDNMHNIRSTPVAGSGGYLGLSGSFSFYGFGSAADTSELDKGASQEGGSAQNFDEWISEKLKEADLSGAVSSYDNEAAKKIKEKLPTAFSGAAETLSEQGTIAKIGNSANVTAGSVSVSADSVISMTAGMGNVSGGVAAGGASVSSITSGGTVKALIDKAAAITAEKSLLVSAKANHSLTDIIVGASAGAVTGQGTVGMWSDATDVYAVMDDTNDVSAEGITVTAENDHTFFGSVTGASVSGYGALNGASLTAKVSGVSEARAGAAEGESAKYKGKISAKNGDVKIASSAKTDLSGTAVGAAIGMYAAGTGTGVSFQSNVDAKTRVGDGVSISGKTVSVTAENTPRLSAVAGSGAASVGAVGVTAALTESKDTAKVSVGDGASVTADETLAIRAEMKKPENAYTAYSHAVAGSGGVIAGDVSVSTVTLDNDTEVVIGKNNTLKAKSASVTARHENLANLQNESVAAGIFSGAGASATYTDISDVKVEIGDGTSIKTAEDTAIKAENISEKGWLSGTDYNVYSGGAALADGVGVVNKTSITHTTKTNLGKVTVSASAPLSAAEKARGITAADKNAITVDARSSITAEDDLAIVTGSAVGAAHINNTTKADAVTQTNVADGAVFTSGDTEAAKGAETKPMTSSGGVYTRDVGGGTIAVGSRNDAKLEGKTLVDVWGAAGYAGGSNDVTYTGSAVTTFGGMAETAKGDIRVAAGRDSAGKTGDISAYAKSDILNATAIPISVVSDPDAVIASSAKLTLTSAGKLSADRDIYLQSKTGNTAASGSGEIKDWAHAVGSAFGSDGAKLGKSAVTGNAEAKLDGKAETGIHRKISVNVGGEDKRNGVWETTVSATGDVSYEFSAEVGVGETLSKRLAELKELRQKYYADSAAVAAYDAEIAFIEQKMVEQGLGYYATANGKTEFVPLDLGKTTEYAAAVTDKNEMAAAKEQTIAALVAEYETTNTQKTSLEAIGTAWDSWKAAEKTLSEAKEEYTKADTAFKTAESAVEAKAKDSGQSLSEYIAAYPQSTEVIAYNEAQTNYVEKKNSYDTAVSNEKSANTACHSGVSMYNTAYGTKYDADNMNRETITTDCNALVSLLSTNQELQNDVTANLAKLTGQISATEKFKEAGGTDANGVFTLDGKTITEYTAADGKSYDLLHFSDYGQKTHDVTVGDITAQLGDILLEGDTVYGAGTLTAAGDASVSVTNATPNNLIVGNVKVLGTERDGKITGGGQIFYNDKAVSSADDIAAANQDSTKSVSFSVKDKSAAAAPTVKIENTFNPKNYTYESVNEDVSYTASYYAAPSLTLAGTVYNTRGAVTVTSVSGDLYNNGSIQAGSVSLSAGSGDFIQSYAGYGTVDNQTAHIGGKPTTDNKDVTTGAGILASGNVFISARYVNVNATIQSGTAEYSLTIPENVMLSYLNDSGETVTATLAEVKNFSAEEKAKRIFTVTGAEGNAADKLTYDAVNERFVVDGLEVTGGKIQIVGTVMNTAESGASAGQLVALDGYGTIGIANNSDTALELRNISTGSGVEGVIEITDLDLSTGKIARKTTYKRNNGTVTRTVQNYEKGEASGDAENIDYASGEKVTYSPAGGLYYQWMEGQDSTTTTKYHLEDTRFDWWGIADETPTEAEILAAGGQIVSKTVGKKTALPEGTVIGTKTSIGWISGDDYYSTNKSTVTTDEKVTAYNVEETRLWYTLGLSKKYDIDMTIQKGETTYTRHAVKASQDIGISFIGNENMGTLNVSGNKADVLIAGTVSNTAGETSISGKNITQAGGWLDTEKLTLTALENAGTAGNALRTTAAEISGSAGGDFAVSVENRGVTLGTVTAGKTASIEAADGITQKAGALLEAQRIELDAGSGAISGAYTDGNISGALHIEAGVPENGADAAYGLKAAAGKNISIYNGAGDLYLDSVTSEAGDVTLVTRGSFVDNNFTDTDNESAKAKLTAWAEAAVLETTAGIDSQATVTKQKELLIDKAESKYNRYQYLKENVTDGKYVLSDAEKEALVAAGLDADEYAAARQAEYDSLVSAGVASWTKESLENYTNSIRESSDAKIYGNADVTAANLSGDDFLTKEEKAEILVGSAKSAKNLLVTFTEGGIKEGVTDTNTSYKATPHVSGAKVTLTALGGDIGKKTEGQTIDLSDPLKLTRAELLALSTAERGDFKADGDKVTVSAAAPISVSAADTLTANAAKGSIYLSGTSAIAAGSSLTAGEEIRLKTSGDITGVTVGAGEQIVLESGQGAISDVTVTGDGVLTARAEDGVDIKKEDGDLVIYAVYASEGDVTLTVKDANILADEKNTTGLHAEGKNISLIGAKNIGNAKTALGVKLGGKEPGALKAKTAGAANLALYGGFTAETETAVSAKTLTLTNHADVAGGSFTAADAFGLKNEKDAEISGGRFTAGGTLDIANAGSITGGTFTGGTVTAANDGTVSGGGFTATTGTLSVTNTGTVTDGTFRAADAMTVTNEGQLTGGNFTAEKAMTLANAGMISGDAAKVSFTGASLAITNTGTLRTGAYTASAGNLTYTDAEGARLGEVEENEKISFTASGDILVNAKEDVRLDTLTAGASATVLSEGDVSVGTLTAAETGILAGGDAEISKAVVSGTHSVLAGGDIRFETIDAGEVSLAGGSVVGTTLNAKKNAGSSGNVYIIATEGDVSIQTSEADGDYLAEAAGDMTLGTVTAENVSLTADGTLTAESVRANRNAELTSGGDISVGTLTAAETGILAGGDAEISEAVVSGTHSVLAGGDIRFETIDAGEVSLAGGSVVGTALNAKKNAGSSGNVDIIAMEGDVSIQTSEADGDYLAEAAGDMTLGTVTAENVSLTADGTLTAESVRANRNAKLTSGGNLEIKETLTAGGSAALVSETGDIILNSVEAGGNLSADAGRDIRFGLSKHVEQSIKAAVLDLKAGRNINLTTKGSRKLAGVDTEEEVKPAYDGGAALIGASGRGHHFDPHGRGTGRIISTAGLISMKAGETAEADSVAFTNRGESTLVISAKDIGIDRLSGRGPVRVILTGPGGRAVHYAGLHAVSPATVASSRIETLNFTGTDAIGVSDTYLSGDSVIATEEAEIRVRANPGRGAEDYFSLLRLDGRNVSSDRPLTEADGGVTVNGGSLPETADTVADRSLYDTEAGKEEREKEKERDGSAEIYFSEILGTETYRVVAM